MMKKYNIILIAERIHQQLVILVFMIKKKSFNKVKTN
jgi:hypothetical protein